MKTNAQRIGKGEARKRTPQGGSEGKVGPINQGKNNSVGGGGGRCVMKKEESEGLWHTNDLTRDSGKKKKTLQKKKGWFGTARGRVVVYSWTVRFPVSDRILPKKWHEEKTANFGKH